MPRWVDGWRAAIGNALLPLHCTLCDAPQPGARLCAACLRDLPWNGPACPCCALPTPTGAPCAVCLSRPPPVDAAFAAFRYEAPVSTHLLRLKKGARFLSARLLAEAMASALHTRPLPLPDVLVPVPLHRLRLWQRGHNQSLEIARHLGRALALPVNPALAQRRRATPHQTGLGAADRRRNLRGAFAVDARVAGQCIAFLDDVMTTGSTLNELARSAKEAGAARVEVWAVARQPLQINR